MPTQNSFNVTSEVRRPPWEIRSVDWYCQN